MPRVYIPQPALSPELALAFDVFNVNTLRAAVIRDLSMNPGGSTTGDIARRLGVDYRQVFAHIQVLEASGVVTADLPDNRAGRRIQYSLDVEELKKQADNYVGFLRGQ